MATFRGVPLEEPYEEMKLEWVDLQGLLIFSAVSIGVSFVVGLAICAVKRHRIDLAGVVGVALPAPLLLLFVGGSVGGLTAVPVLLLLLVLEYATGNNLTHYVAWWFVVLGLISGVAAQVIFMWRNL